MEAIDYDAVHGLLPGRDYMGPLSAVKLLPLTKEGTKVRGKGERGETQR